MRFWPFGNKQAAMSRAETKSASFLYGMGALQQMQTNYLALASEGYGQNPVVHGCIEKIVTPITSVELKAYKKDKDGKLVEVENHPMLALLRKPNPAMTGEDLIGNFFRYFLISGNAYMLAPTIDAKAPTKPPKELYLLKPNCVKVITGEKPIPIAYEYSNKNGTAIRYPVEQVDGKSAIMHKKTFNPIDEFTGLSPMVSAAFAVDMINEGNRWNLRLLQNEGRPSGALTVKGADGSPQTLSEEQYQRMKTQIDQQFTGSGNAGRPLLLEGGLEWKEMSMSSKDMDHKENINNSKRDIALAYGVPPMLLGIPGDATYSNMDAAKLALWTDTILPLLGSFLESLNNWLAPIYGDGVELWYDADTIPALEPLRKMLADRIEASNSMKVNEKRKAMGLEDIEGGDVLLVDSGKIPLEMAGDMGLAEPGSPADQGNAN